MWYYEDKIFDPEEHSYDKYAGFVYIITDLSNHKKYVGKKLFWKVHFRPSNLFGPCPEHVQQVYLIL